MRKGEFKSFTGLCTFALAAIASLAPVALAQVTGPQVPSKNPQGQSLAAGKIIQVNVELALVNVTVTDPYSRMVTGLQKTNFHIFEDDVEQEILTFSNEDLPISIGLILDMSGSMADKVDKAKEAVIQFLKTVNPRDEVFLVTFSDRAKLMSGFTSNFELLQSQITHTKPNGQTALLDAIYLGLNQMKTAHRVRRALVVISDGGDNHSRHNEAYMRSLLKEADCQLYAVGVFDVNNMGRSSEERYGPSLLAELAEMTGGRLFVVSDPSDLRDTYTKIGMELRNQYVLGYKPSNPQHDGIWRTIKVKLASPGGLPPLKVYAKTGYYAPAP